MATASAHYPPQTVVVYTQSAWSRFWSWVGWLGFFICGLIILGLLVASAAPATALEFNVNTVHAFSR